MPKILIKNGLVTDPRQNAQYVADVLITGRRVAKIRAGINCAADIAINASGLWVCPGLFDMHAHFRDPGYTHKEDILSGQDAALAGGYAAVLVMPNNSPVTDSPEAVFYIRRKAGKTKTKVFVCGAVTKNYGGAELADIRGMAAAGAAALSEDGKSVENAALLKRAMAECAKLNIPMLSHCENLNAPSREAETSFITRDIGLARETGARLHICHVSEKKSVEIIREAKKQGVKITCEASPHHIALTKTPENENDPAFKVNPPLRTESDAEALIEGLIDGTVDVIATDHAPHGAAEKSGAYETAAPGFIGLETAVSVCVTKLVKPGRLTPPELIKKMSSAPASVLNAPFGGVYEGCAAHITIIDPNRKYTVEAALFRSKSQNSPFVGQTLTGKVKYTLINGRIAYADTP